MVINKKDNNGLVVPVQGAFGVGTSPLGNVVFTLETDGNSYNIELGITELLHLLSAVPGAVNGALEMKLKTTKPKLPKKGGRRKRKNS